MLNHDRGLDDEYSVLSECSALSGLYSIEWVEMFSPIRAQALRRRCF
jgi:hypothetical protein